MFNQIELDCIDLDYFDIILAGCFAVTVQSKNTKHYWHILHEVGRNYSTCQISHKHHYENPLHRQCNRPNLASSLDEIKSHDTYHLKRQKKKKYRKHTLRHFQ